MRKFYETEVFICLSYTSRLAVFVSLSSDDDPKPSGDLLSIKAPSFLKEALRQRALKSFCVKSMPGKVFRFIPEGL